MDNLGYGGEMTELKTLKDLDRLAPDITSRGDCGSVAGMVKTVYADDDITFVRRAELKQEAIAWIKELNICVIKCTKMKMSYARAEYIAKIEWIKHFFNINSEELK